MRRWTLTALFCAALTLTVWCEYAWKDAVGRWQIFHTDGTPIYVTLYPNHKARSSWENETGHWTVVDGRLVMIWSDGWRDVITTEQGRYRKAGYAPGNRDLAAPSNRTAAYKL